MQPTKSKKITRD